MCVGENPMMKNDVHAILKLVGDVRREQRIILCFVVSINEASVFIGLEGERCSWT